VNERRILQSIPKNYIAIFRYIVDFYKDPKHTLSQTMDLNGKKIKFSKQFYGIINIEHRPRCIEVKIFNDTISDKFLYSFKFSPRNTFIDRCHQKNIPPEEKATIT
jgi:hypothetical protein